MDSQEKAATYDEFPSQCAYCLRTVQDGARLFTQTTITGRAFSYCENTFACNLAEQDLRSALAEHFPEVTR